MTVAFLVCCGLIALVGLALTDPERRRFRQQAPAPTGMRRLAGLALAFIGLACAWTTGAAGLAIWLAALALGGWTLANLLPL